VSVVPSPEVKSELVRLLHADNSRLGDVYRLTERGLRPDQIAAELGVATPGFVSNYRTCVRALLDGHIPSGSTIAAATARGVRRVGSAPGISTEAAHHCELLATELERVAGAPAPPDRASGSDAASSVRRPGRRRARGGRWNDLARSEIDRHFRPGEIFSFRELYRRAEPKLREEFPENTALEASLANVLQKLRDDGFLEFVRRGEYRYQSSEEPDSTVERPESGTSDLTGRLEDLVRRIDRETGVEASDYRDAAGSGVPEYAVRSIVLSTRISPTFFAMFQADRLDLTLEQLVLEHTGGVDPEVVERARDRLSYYRRTDT
jgi:hypothetical protein